MFFFAVIEIFYLKWREFDIGVYIEFALILNLSYIVMQKNSFYIIFKQWFCFCI